MAATRRELIGLGGTAAVMALVGWGTSARAKPKGPFAVTKSDAAWRQQLGPEAFAVLRQESTERPYTSPLNKEHRAGTFLCKGCALPLFSSKTKYDSGTGWPSFWAPLANAVGTSSDTLLGYERVEVHCRRCGGHLGHVFDDGPKPTGKRYCMNGVAMTFRPAKRA